MNACAGLHAIEGLINSGDDCSIFYFCDDNKAYECQKKYGAHPSLTPPLRIPPHCGRFGSGVFKKFSSIKCARGRGLGSHGAPTSWKSCPVDLVCSPGMIAAIPWERSAMVLSELTSR
jgi:hypothetical protein